MADKKKYVGNETALPKLWERVKYLINSIAKVRSISLNGKSFTPDNNGNINIITESKDTLVTPPSCALLCDVPTTAAEGNYTFSDSIDNYSYLYFMITGKSDGEVQGAFIVPTTLFKAVLLKGGTTGGFVINTQVGGREGFVFRNRENGASDTEFHIVPIRINYPMGCKIYGLK